MSHRHRPAPRGSPAGGTTAAGPAVNGSAVSWESLYDRLPQDQRAMLLSRAEGIVAAEQVPSPSTPPPQLLQRLLSGDSLIDLPPRPDGDATALGDFDPSARSAVALALRTPDVALIHGTDHSIVAEAIAAALRRVERVLLIAPDGPALDRVLDRLADRPEICPLRCLCNGENESALPATAANCTFAAHNRRLTEQARAQAKERLAACVDTCRRRDAEAAVYDHLVDLAEQHQRLQARYESINGSPRLRSDEVSEIERSLAELRPLAAARSAGRWWTPSWWRAVFAGDVVGRLAEVESKHNQAEAEAAAVAEQAVALDRQRAVIADKWQQALRQLPADDPRPDAFSAYAAATARDAWGRCRDADRRDLEFARAWSDGLEPLLEELPGRLLEIVNLVAASPAALAADRYFGDDHRGPFDLLVVVDSHTIADTDLLTVARRSRRWLLFGEPLPKSSFARLWSLLHCDPWQNDNGRVVCRLRSLPPNRQLDREPVVDRPDVVLGIHSPFGGEPQLAEVAFPAGTSIAEAVEFVFRELGELPSMLGPDCPISLSNDPLRGCPDSALSIDLGGGVRAIIETLPAGWDIAAIVFDPTAWDQERAAAWVRRHVVRPHPGRTIRAGRQP